MTATLEVSCDALGLGSPSVSTHVRLLRGRRGWTLLARTVHPQPQETIRWLSAYDPISLRVAPTSAGRIVQADFDGPPAPLAKHLEQFRIIQFIAEPNGRALVTVEGSRERVRDFAVLTAGEDPLAEVRGVTSESTPPLLSRRQQRAVIQAAERGYYSVPRTTDQRAIAQALGVSPAALSELLRRAEARIILWFLRAEIEAPPEGPGEDAVKGAMQDASATGGAPPGEARRATSRRPRFPHS